MDNYSNALSQLISSLEITVDGLQSKVTSMEVEMEKLKENNNQTSGLVIGECKNVCDCASCCYKRCNSETQIKISDEKIELMAKQIYLSLKKNGGNE